MRRRGEKTVGAVLLSWWLVLLILFGLGFNAFFAFKFWQGGHVGGAIMFAIFFCGACVYLYRTYNARDGFRGLFKE
jgi:hypothetical protein